MEFFHKKTNFPFMATRKVWYTLSAILMVGSFISFFVYGLNFAIDFTGGISVEATFPKQVDIGAVRRAVIGAGFHDPQVSYLGSTRDVTIGLQPTGQTADQVRPMFQSALATIDPGVKISALEVVGPQVGDELRYAAITSLAVTLLLIALYIILRFHTWRLSLGAILAVMHDPILVLGVFSITQTKFDLAVVAAILAVIGYSLNDTVIVFDRIRENFEKNRRQASHLTLDQAINQTLSRTIMTKVTTSIVVVALLLLGGEALRGFSEALLIGIVAGT
jgi:preprotein translocase subunit SecF